MLSLRGSIAARLLLSYGLLGVMSMVAVANVFYFGTIGVLDKNIDDGIQTQAQRFAGRAAAASPQLLAEEVRRQLNDGIDSDREIYLLLDSSGSPLAGNVAKWAAIDSSPAGIFSRDVVRNGAPSHARLLVTSLPLGGTLVIGYDLGERSALRNMVGRSLAEGTALSLVFTVIGALLFRRQIARRIGDIRRAANEVGDGDLKRRIPVSGTDEFALLNRDINTMLDRIGQLMDGIRNVSNAIAHDLRTPLTRIRGKLDDALRHERSVEVLAGAAQGAIEDIDELIRLFERLLQIAEVESGMNVHADESIDLQRIASDIADLFDATAEAERVRLSVAPGAPVLVHADRNLIANAIASLIDNAIKHAGPNTTVSLSTAMTARGASITVRDDGPGIPAGEHGKVIERFYRLDKSRAIPGNGLGLSIVQAIATAHGGELSLSDADPGLAARIDLPRETSMAATTRAR
ncbi:HAMP domain-containing sensor histidine kinase [Massilia sp. R2A-15]|uniref:HAMP domain-containing sensor histidine kinase n=1 Tax=Massilia sp. R2A-15 TaxID=3064278 RepID=UPI00273419A5|nr:HAMP domain-containing sensor histidine kinase [Massilia sp. R2A-15]WLI91141.1 HAMP domain-containing sensor histidine kinase [Massilia sp. R2A-15]